MATSPSPPTNSGGGSTATSKVFLMVAVLLGILATVLAFLFINNAGASNTGPQIYITVAKHDMSPNMPIDPERDLTQIQVPARFSSLAVRCLDWQSRANYKGDRVNRDIFAGQPILVADTAAIGDLVLEKPNYAFMIYAEPGLIIPGDYVKIIKEGSAMVSAASPVPVAASPGSVTVIGKDPGFKVLAVGNYLHKTRPQTTTNDQSGSNSLNKTVWLQVTEDQAKEIVASVGQVNSANKLMLLVCPSKLTEPASLPDTELPAAPAAATRTSTKP